MRGQRIPVERMNGHTMYPALRTAGDYCGPVMGWTGDRPAVFFLTPNADDAMANWRARTIQHVCSPPHMFVEEPDGTLTVRDSIGGRVGQGKTNRWDKVGRNKCRQGKSRDWHGYLTKGEWHL